MSSFEFKVAKNMAQNNGLIEGYFAVQSDYSGVSGKIATCLIRIESSDMDALCIPIVTDEFGVGENLGKFFGLHEQFAGLLTFGEDETQYSSRIPVQSHMDIMVREIGKERPNFLSALLSKPTPMSNSEWKLSKPLDELHLRYGRVMIKDQACRIEATDALPPLYN
jgi:hypothetical protein